MDPTSTTISGTFPVSMAFRKTWRSYQARVLDCLDSYLDDKRLHVAAAPGSGKTVLGIEIIRRLNQPTLVLAPTITIRDQWVERLADSFLPAAEPFPFWVSLDLRKPAPLTLATYQALHSLCTHMPGQVSEPIGEEDQTHEEDPDGFGETETAIRIPEILDQFGFKTLVVDEAHHLRAEWWKTLTLVAQSLNDPTIVALTATPPYDVSALEWQRYEGLCGPVDTEVSVPELVLQGDLCPHQDYVYLSTPTAKDQKIFTEFRAAVDLFVRRLQENQAFTASIETHPWLASPDAYAQEIAADPLYASSKVVYLNAFKKSIPSQALRALGMNRKHIPALDLDWLEILLTHCLYPDTHSYSGSAEVFKQLRHELQEIGAIERHRVSLRSPWNRSKLLTRSVTKLKSIEHIVRLEFSDQSSNLRCAILADFIRKTDVTADPGETGAFGSVGVVPIFETLRRAAIPGLRLGVLSGSLVIIPSAAELLLRQVALSLGIRPSDLSIAPLAHDPAYAVVELHGEYYQGTVRLMTAVFEQGRVCVLVGTKSLLGEGWDAPCINTLILSTFVGSYVLSNQMRGRSIRVDPSHPKKTANIWHLVCIEPGASGPGEDYELLVRRCRAFVGVSATSMSIESGSERLALPQPPFRGEQIDESNARTCTRALDRAGLQELWRQALSAATSKELAAGLKTPENLSPQGFILRSTVGQLLFQAGSTFLAFFLQSMRDPAGGSAQNVLFYGAAAAAVISCPWAALAGWRLIRHGTPERSIRQIGRVVLDCLESEGSISRAFASERKFHIYSNRNTDGSVFCWLSGGTGQEQAVFLRALAEALSPVASPRYLLAREPLLHIFHEDYFAVPEVLSRKMGFAQEFAERWRRSVGPVQLVSTHTPEGRKILLRARLHSLAATFQNRAERMSRWR
jgi:superfamily II DNA or RNA helicase